MEDSQKFDESQTKSQFMGKILEFRPEDAENSNSVLFPWDRGQTFGVPTQEKEELFESVQGNELQNLELEDEAPIM